MSFNPYSSPTSGATIARRHLLEADDFPFFLMGPLPWMAVALLKAITLISTENLGSNFGDDDNSVEFFAFSIVMLSIFAAVYGTLYSLALFVICRTLEIIPHQRIHFWTIMLTVAVVGFSHQAAPLLVLACGSITGGLVAILTASHKVATVR